MRQRYLLGRHNRQRYVEELDLLSATYNPSEIYMQSTNVNRTMQSGYSELMGLYPPSHESPFVLTPEQSEALKTISAPPFKVKDADAINEKLGNLPLPEGFVQIAITEFNNHDIHDDASTDGCPFINDDGKKREVDDSIWAKYNWMQQ